MLVAVAVSDAERAIVAGLDGVRALAIDPARATMTMHPTIETNPQMAKARTTHAATRAQFGVSSFAGGMGVEGNGTLARGCEGSPFSSASENDIPGLIPRMRGKLNQMRGILYPPVALNGVTCLHVRVAS
jgi:hypothetical protein